MHEAWKRFLFSAPSIRGGWGERKETPTWDGVPEVCPLGAGSLVLLGWGWQMTALSLQLMVAATMLTGNNLYSLSSVPGTVLSTELIYMNLLGPVDNSEVCTVNSPIL